MVAGQTSLHAWQLLLFMGTMCRVEHDNSFSCSKPFRPDCLLTIECINFTYRPTRLHAISFSAPIKIQAFSLYRERLLSTRVIHQLVKRADVFKSALSSRGFVVARTINTAPAECFPAERQWKFHSQSENHREQHFHDQRFRIHSKA